MVPTSPHPMVAWTCSQNRKCQCFMIFLFSLFRRTQNDSSAGEGHDTNSKKDVRGTLAPAIFPGLSCWRRGSLVAMKDAGAFPFLWDPFFILGPRPKNTRVMQCVPRPGKHKGHQATAPGHKVTYAHAYVPPCTHKEPLTNDSNPRGLNRG